MQNICKSFHPNWCKKVTVLIYQTLSVAEAIGIGFAMNRDDANGLRMTDYEIVRSEDIFSLLLQE